MKFNELPAEEQNWMDAYVNGTIGRDAFDQLQARLLASAELRAVMRRYLALDHHLQENLASLSATEQPWLAVEPGPKVVQPRQQARWWTSWVPMAAAASLAFFLGLAIMRWGSPAKVTPGAVAMPEAKQPSARGFAVIGRLFDAQWPEQSAARREGDTLEAEVFRLAAGTAEIQFFCGASMTVEGPAKIALKSAWEASCHEGAVRVRVPPAARGFKLQAPSTEIVDLGTEFGLLVRDGKEHVEVFDGEIALQNAGADRSVLKKGAALGLMAGAAHIPAAAGAVAFPEADRNGDRAAAQRLSDFERWRAHRDALARDSRLLLYYTFDHESPASLIPNLAKPQNPELDGAVVLAEPVDGRWPGLKSALEFRRPGSRVRVNVPGEFAAFTFSAWVRIDSLDRWYNALFMADSYETGEPHWQIQNDGRMIFSVMVDDARPDPKSKTGGTMRFQHLYYSPPMWEPSMSGQWMHVASVFDPANAQVSHYVNGKRISREDILPKYLIHTLRIGNAEVGNWGQPFREDPTFAIRNLNGRMDELAIFKAALDDGEVRRLYEESRSGAR